ncbi:MAG: sulfatase-like hydrolase/transferase [bacterium]|nr:sulfatase-like hydrolase/transferase [bacterium]
MPIRRFLVFFTFVLQAFTLVLHGAPQADEWQPLLTPGTLDGWHTAPGGSWEWEDDVLVGKSPKSETRHGLLISDARYTDFEARLEFRTVSGCSGFYFRVDETEKSTGVAGFQAEVDPSFETGGLYETGGRAWVVKPDPEAMRAIYRPGEWTEMAVRADGRDVEVRVNGQVTAELTDDPGRREGHFALQLHGDQDLHVEFRNVRVRELTRRPNVLIVLADDMGYGDAHCFDERSKIPTPHIDRLAREGMRFTDAHAPGAWCVPSRYGLLTGRYPFRKGGFRPGREPVIDAGRVTVASLLRAAGYGTAMVGKWHLGFEGGAASPGAELRGGPLDRGFQRFFGIHASLDIPPYYYIDGRAPLAPPTEAVGASATEGWTNIQGAFWRAGKLAPGFVHADVLGRFTREATDALRALAAADEPFFLYVALASPHTPWLPSKAFAGKSGADLYGDFVAETDAALGTLLAALDESGVADDTLVLFTSDNGPVWYPADVERFGHSATGPWRGMKSDSWEGGHRMPFVVRWPREVDAGTVCERTVCFTDVMATLADAANLALPEGAGEDSRSMLPLLRDPSAPPTREVTVLKQNASVVRAGRWKLITHLGSGGFSRPRKLEPAGELKGQLYDLEADPGETTNLWSAKPEIVARLTELLAQLR